MDHSFLSALVLLLLVLDPFGSLPIFVSVLQGVAPERRRRVALREVLIAFSVLLAFMRGGQAGGRPHPPLVGRIDGVGD